MKRVLGMTLMLLAMPGQGTGQEPADKIKMLKEQSQANLRKIAAAFEMYREANGHFPVGLVEANRRVQGLSWRVQILPYFDDPALKKLYDRFRLKEPWDSEHNLKLLTEIPKIYAPVRGTAEGGHTFYQGFADNFVEGGDKKWPKGSVPYGYPGALLPDPRVFVHFTEKELADNVLPDRSRRVISIADGTSNTFLAAEAATAVPWTKPADIPYRRETEKPREGTTPTLGGMFGGDFHVVMVDGTVYPIKKAVPAENLRSFVTTAGDDYPDFFGIGHESAIYPDFRPFVGKWVRSNFEENGKKPPIDENKKYTLTFTRDMKVIYAENGTTLFEGRLNLCDLHEGKAKAKTMSWYWEAQKIEDLVLYRFDGDNKFLACWTHEKDRPTPSRFATGVPDGGTYLAVWQRVP